MGKAGRLRDTARRAAEEVLDASVAVPDAELVAPLLVPLAEVAVADALETEAGLAMRRSDIYLY